MQEGTSSTHIWCTTSGTRETNLSWSCRAACLDVIAYRWSTPPPRLVALAKRPDTPFPSPILPALSCLYSRRHDHLFYPHSALIMRSPSPPCTSHDASCDLVSCMFLFPSLATPCAYRDLICFSAVAFHFYSFLLAYTLIPPFLYHSSLRSFHLISISCTDPLRIYNLFPTGIYLGRVPTFSP